MPATERHFQEVVSPPSVSNKYGSYQFERLRAAMKLCKPRRTALDVGGHVGLWAKHLCRYFKQVVSFEPNPNILPYYRVNMAAELQTGRAVLNDFGLSNVTGTLDLVYVPDNTGSTHVRESDEEADPAFVSVVAMRRLDDLELPPIDFIKIDCEGYEEFVLRGGERTIRANKPVIVVEQKAKYSGKYRTAKNSAGDLLIRWGMRLHAKMYGDLIMRW